MTPPTDWNYAIVPMLTYFRQIAEAMHAEPTNWEWIGPHMSQRMFGITQARAEAYANPEPAGFWRRSAC